MFVVFVFVFSKNNQIFYLIFGGKKMLNFQQGFGSMRSTDFSRGLLQRKWHYVFGLVR